MGASHRHESEGNPDAFIGAGGGREGALSRVCLEVRGWGLLSPSAFVPKSSGIPRIAGEGQGGQRPRVPIHRPAVWSAMCCAQCPPPRPRAAVWGIRTKHLRAPREDTGRLRLWAHATPTVRHPLNDGRVDGGGGFGTRPQWGGGAGGGGFQNCGRWGVCWAKLMGGRGWAGGGEGAEFWPPKTA